MTEHPGQRLLDRRHRLAGRTWRPPHDDHRQARGSRAASSLARCQLTAAVLGHHELDPVAVDQRALARRACTDRGRAAARATPAAAAAAGRHSGSETTRRRSPRTRSSPWRPVVSSTRRPSAGDRGGRAVEVVDPDPSGRPARSRPARSLEAQQRHGRCGARDRGRGRDPLGERMGGVDDRPDPVVGAASRASASGPPKPPIRTSPAGSRGRDTRPGERADDGDAALRRARPPARAASPVPPSIRIIGREARARGRRRRRRPGADHGRGDQRAERGRRDLRARARDRRPDRGPRRRSCGGSRLGDRRRGASSSPSRGATVPATAYAAAVHDWRSRARRRLGAGARATSWATMRSAPSSSGATRRCMTRRSRCSTRCSPAASSRSSTRSSRGSAASRR